MKVGLIVTTNAKGQVVIPQAMRKQLGIKKNTVLNAVVRDDALRLYPIRGVETDSQTQQSYIHILKQTQGSWESEDEREAERRKLELEAAEKRKSAW